MTLASIGSLVYLIFALINCLSFSPVAGTKNSNDTAAIGKADSENTPVHFAETQVAFLGFAVGQVFGNDTVRISEGILSQRNGTPYFFWFSTSLSESQSNRVLFIGIA